MSRVYVVQRTMGRDEGGRLVERFGIEKAGHFGQLVDLLSPSARPFSNLGHLIDEMRRKLADYRDGDYLLCIGNPVLIGWAVALAADVNGGRVACLQWSGTYREYLPVHGRLWDDD